MWLWNVSLFDTWSHTKWYRWDSLYTASCFDVAIVYLTSLVTYNKLTWNSRTWKSICCRVYHSQQVDSPRPVIYLTKLDFQRLIFSRVLTFSISIFPIFCCGSLCQLSFVIQVTTLDTRILDFSILISLFYLKFS